MFISIDPQEEIAGQMGDFHPTQMNSMLMRASTDIFADVSVLPFRLAGWVRSRDREGKHTTVPLPFGGGGSRGYSASRAWREEGVYRGERANGAAALLLLLLMMLIMCRGW